MLDNSFIDTLAGTIAAADTTITLTTNFTDVEEEIGKGAQVYLRLVNETTGDSEIVIAYASTGTALTVLRAGGGSVAMDWPAATLVKLVQVVNQSEASNPDVCGNEDDCDDPAYEIVQYLLLSPAQLLRLCTGMMADAPCRQVIWQGIVDNHLSWDGTQLCIDFNNDGDPNT